MAERPTSGDRLREKLGQVQAYFKGDQQWRVIPFCVGFWRFDDAGECVNLVIDEDEKEIQIPLDVEQCQALRDLLNQHIEKYGANK